MAAQPVTDAPEIFPADIRSAEARSLYRLVANLGSGMAQHATRVDQRFVAFEGKLDAFIGGLRLELGSLKSGAKLKSVPPGPPSREESPSSIDLLAQATREVKEKLGELARKTPGEKVEASPAELSAMVEGVVAKVLTSREEASELKSYRQQKKLRQAAVGAFVLAVASAAGAAAWQRGAGRAEGLIEGRSAHSAATAPAPAR